MASVRKTVLRCLPALATMPGAVGLARPAWAEGDECIDLYVKRNQIYADAHYCFKTKKALSYFSNKDCVPGEPRLTPGQQHRIAEIQAASRRYQCRD
jgi:YARHG domain